LPAPYHFLVPKKTITYQFKTAEVLQHQRFLFTTESERNTKAEKVTTTQTAMYPAWWVIIMYSVYYYFSR